MTALPCPGIPWRIPHNMSTPSDPNADLYAFIFNMVESQPHFRVGARKPAAAPLSPAMLARPYKGVLPDSYAVEPKIDGVRVIVEVCRESLAVSFKTRNGNPLPSIDHLGAWFAERCAVRHSHGSGRTGVAAMVWCSCGRRAAAASHVT